jgi:hypothetical protein
MLTCERARQVFFYEELSGKLIWNRRPEEEFANSRLANIWNQRWAGKAAGTIDHKGYLIVCVDSHEYRAHRVVWLMHYGMHAENQIDHINGVKSDNRISNLRDVHNIENSRNRSRRQDNTSGHTGVVWHKTVGKWIANIGVNGRLKYIGVFDRKEDAVAARKAAEILYGFHPNHGRAA